ncbi:MAG: hypothetical protein ACYDBB_20940 [Armatimonadota bacterium]
MTPRPMSIASAARFECDANIVYEELCRRAKADYAFTLGGGIYPEHPDWSFLKELKEKDQYYMVAPPMHPRQDVPACPAAYNCSRKYLSKKLGLGIRRIRQVFDHLCQQGRVICVAYRGFCYDYHLPQMPQHGIPGGEVCER